MNRFVCFSSNHILRIAKHELSYLYPFVQSFWCSTAKTDHLRKIKRIFKFWKENSDNLPHLRKLSLLLLNIFLSSASIERFFAFLALFRKKIRSIWVMIYYLLEACSNLTINCLIIIVIILNFYLNASKIIIFYQK
jgi:hypothetical protein